MRGEGGVCESVSVGSECVTVVLVVLVVSRFCRASVPVEWERYAKVRSGQAGAAPGAGPGCRLWVEADVAPSRIDVAPGVAAAL